LCKTVAVVDNQIVHLQNDQDVGSNETDTRRMAQLQSQANFSWVKPGIVLKIWKQQAIDEKPTRTSTSDSEKTLAASGAQTRIDLFCFGAPHTLYQRFQTLLATAKYSDILKDPYLLLEVVFEEMYKILDGTVWTVADIFGVSETVWNPLLEICVYAKWPSANLGAGDQTGTSYREATQDSFHRAPQPRKAHRIPARELRGGLGYPG